MQRLRTNNRLGRIEIAGCQTAGGLHLLGNFESIRRWVALSVTITLLLVCGAVASGPDLTERAADPLSLYGPTVDFNVFREGEKVGFHRVRFERSGEELIVASTFELEIRVLFFTAFRYLYQSEGRWRSGPLVRLRADVNDDGRSSFTEAVLEDERMMVTNGDGGVVVDGLLFPTNQLNIAVLPETRVLNTLMGRINSVRVEPRGRETVLTEWGDVTAPRYAYTNDLGTEVWYDDARRWVKLRFKGRDGPTIEYLCRPCQGADVNQAEG